MLPAGEEQKVSPGVGVEVGLARRWTFVREKTGGEEAAVAYEMENTDETQFVLFPS